MARWGRVFAGTLIIGSVTGCALLTGVGDLHEGPIDEEDVASLDRDGGATSLDGGASDGNITDSQPSVLQDVTTTVVDGCSPTGCFDMPGGFSLVAFAASTKANDCPAGFALPVDTVEKPSAAAGACTCGCTVTAPPSCQNGTIIGHFSTGTGMCENAGGNMVSNTCASDGFLGAFDVGNEHRYTPPPPTGGACTAAPVKDPTKLSFGAQGRLCQATVVPKCEAKTCAPSLDSAGVYQACIATTGDVACPAAFPTKHLVGTGAAFDCGPGCACGGVTATCRGALQFFATPNCVGAPGAVFPVNDTCVPTTSNPPGASYASHRYVPTMMNVACTTTGSTAPANVNVLQPATVCCN